MKRKMRAILCCCLALTMLFVGSACSIYSERKKVDRGYMEKRKVFLTAGRPSEGEVLTVFAAIADIDQADHVKSIACAADGSVSLYLSTGEVYEGLHVNNPEVADAAMRFLQGMSERIELATWQNRTDLALPDTGKDLLYLVTDQGIHTLTVIPAYVPESNEKAQEVYGLYRALYDAVVKAVPAENNT